MASNPVWRIRALSGLIFLFALVIIGKLFLIQIVHSKEFVEAADRQYTTPASHLYDRGSIFLKERSGELASAATLSSGFMVALNPKQIPDPEALYKKMTAVVPISRDEFIAKTSKKNDPYEEVAHRISRAEADKLSALALPGVSIYKEKWRFYPLENMAARIIGFVGYNGNDFNGRYGVERYYEEVLGR